MDNLWLPEGHVWDLHIERHSINSNLSFTGGGWKIVWHTTETPWNWYEIGVNYFTGDARGKAPHFLIGGKSGAEHPFVAQFVPLNESSFALQNDTSDGRDTNRAHAIQVEICGYADSSQDWLAARYKALANLFVLIDHRQNILNSTQGRDFSKPRRLSDQEWVDASGHTGHCNAPDNTHYDPGHLRDGYLVDLIDKCPDGGWAL